MGFLNSIIGIIALACAIWVIYEVLTSKKKSSTGKKIVWIVCALLFNIITAIVYYLVEKKK
ncbi:MAG: PLDc N-terminal domain-containing protein [Candidatus Woesearchaeota archaeon]|jgi:hypothetical protein